MKVEHASQPARPLARLRNNKKATQSPVLGGMVMISDDDNDDKKAHFIFILQCEFDSLVQRYNNNIQSGKVR